MLCSFCYSNNSRLFLFGHIALEFVLRCNALRSIAKKLLQDNALKPKEKPKGNSFHLRLLCAFPLCHLSAARTTCGHFCRLSRIVYAAFPSTLLPGARHTHTRQSTVDSRCFYRSIKNKSKLCSNICSPGQETECALKYPRTYFHLHTYQCKWNGTHICTHVSRIKTLEYF